MKKIGFIDYFLSEWHANNYPDWIKAVSDKNKSDFVVSYAWAELDVSPYDGVTTEEWCGKFKVKNCTTIDEVCENSDFIVILAPDNSEKHLEYAEKALKFGKPTYIDKTFAPDLITAEKIYKLSERYAAPIFSASALRYADEFGQIGGELLSLITTGGGADFERYAVHQVEMIVRLMGVGATRVMSALCGKNKVAVIDYGKKTAVLNYSESNKFSINAEMFNGGARNNFYTNIESDVFMNMIGDLLRFFESGVASFEKAQTLEIMTILDALTVSQLKPFEWCKI